MKVIYSLLLAFFLSSLCIAQEKKAGMIQSAILKKYDVNKNGQLDDNEQLEILKKYDANENGKLDRAEKKVLAKEFKKSPSSNKKNNEGEVKWNTVGLVQANSMGCGEAKVSSSGNFRVFIMMGQSNMHGTAKAKELETPHNQKHERIRIWANGRWEYLVPTRVFGPEIAMAHQLAEKWQNDTIGIIKISSGGTGIRAFEKKWTEERANLTYDGHKGSMYNDLMNIVSEAKKISSPLFSGFIWKQGAADGTRKELAEEYYETFKQLVNDIRKDLNTPEMPVLILTYSSDENLAKVTLKGKREHLKIVLMAHNKAGREIENTVTIHHGKDLPMMKDGVHFNHEGQFQVGKLTAIAIEEFYKKN
jgi:hypothetical protein